MNASELRGILFMFELNNFSNSLLSVSFSKKAEALDEKVVIILKQ